MPTIPERPGVEIFINKGGNISLLQRPRFDDEQVVSISADDIPRVIKVLQDLHKELLESPAGTFDEEQENGDERAATND